MMYVIQDSKLFLMRIGCLPEISGAVHQLTLKIVRPIVADAAALQVRPVR